MIKECIKSKSFKIYKDTNNCKFELLKNKAEEILKYRNTLSKLVCNNFLEFSDLSKYDFFKKYNSINPQTIRSQDAQKALEDVYISYNNKKDQLFQQITFKLQKEIRIEKYKNNSKYGNKGDTKSYSVTLKETKFTRVCSYLARYYNENLINYVKEQIKDEKIDANKKEFYLSILHYVDKFGKRLIDLALEKRNRIIEYITKYPIEFRSKTFRSTNRIQHDIISENKNKNSKYNSFIILGGFKDNNQDHLEIPTKHSKKFHGELNNYVKNQKEDCQKQVSYTIVFKGNKPDRITLTLNCQEDIPTDKINYIGVDTNVKHNMFFTSTNQQIDYDRKMIEDYCNFIKRIDATQKRKKHLNNLDQEERKISNKNLRSWNIYRQRLKAMMKRKVRELVNLSISEGKDHIVVEDLGNFAKTYINSEEFEGIKYSRLVRLLNLSDLKNIILSIARKNGIQVTFIQPEYTSKTCPYCGNIDDNNRKTQEEFCCTRCGKHGISDYISSINILNRLFLDVLRNSLLTKTEYGYIPKRIGKDLIKEAIISNYTYS